MKRTSSTASPRPRGTPAGSDATDHVGRPVVARRPGREDQVRAISQARQGLGVATQSEVHFSAGTTAARALPRKSGQGQQRDSTRSKDSDAEHAAEGAVATGALKALRDRGQAMLTAETWRLRHLSESQRKAELCLQAVTRDPTEALWVPPSAFTQGPPKASALLANWFVANSPAYLGMARHPFSGIVELHWDWRAKGGLHAVMNEAWARATIGKGRTHKLSDEEPPNAQGADERPTRMARMRSRAVREVFGMAQSQQLDGGWGVVVAYDEPSRGQCVLGRGISAKAAWSSALIFMIDNPQKVEELKKECSKALPAPVTRPRRSAKATAAGSVDGLELDDDGIDDDTENPDD